MVSYNGHLNWNYWNVSLWINNDECLYNLALQAINQMRKSDSNYTLTMAAGRFLDAVGEVKTPDGAPYTMPSVRAALKFINS